MDHGTLLSCIEEIYSSGTSFIGKDIKSFDVVDGLWRLRIEFSSDGTFKNLQLRSPRSSEVAMYSMKRIRQVLGTLICMRIHTRQTLLHTCSATVLSLTGQFSSRGDTLSHQAVSHTNTISEHVGGLTMHADPRAMVAVIRIQAQFRGRRLWTSHRQWVEAVHAMNRAIVALDVTCQDMEKFRISFEQCAKHEALMCALYPNALERENLIRDENQDICATSFDATKLTRHEVAQHARRLLIEHSDFRDGLPYTCAKAFHRSPTEPRELHYPIIVSSLSLPECGKYQWMHGTRLVHIRVSTELCASHKATLEDRFNETWKLHCANLLLDDSRDMKVFDVFSDKYFKKYEGSTILSKFLGRKFGQYSPMIHIDSFVSKVKGGGYGHIMFEMVKSLLFDYTNRVPKGVVFAQCLPVPFWEDRLFSNAYARALILQMNCIDSNYIFEIGCDARSSDVDNVEYMTSSPTI